MVHAHVVVDDVEVGGGFHHAPLELIGADQVGEGDAVEQLGGGGNQVAAGAPEDGQTRAGQRIEPAWWAGVRAFRVGRWMLVSVAIFGAATVAFGFSRNLALSIALLVIIGRALRAATRGLAHLLGRRLPSWAGLSIGGVIVALLVVLLLVAGFKGFEKLTNDIYGKKNATTAEGVVQPQSTMRSGSSASLVSWQSLGMQGRNFVGRGPTVAQLEAFNGSPPKEPIRVYVGLDSAPTAEARAALAIRELQRTDAFTRKLLVLSLIHI